MGETKGGGERGEEGGKKRGIEREVLTEGCMLDGATEEGLSSLPMRVWFSNDFPTLFGGSQHLLFTTTCKGHAVVHTYA